MKKTLFSICAAIILAGCVKVEVDWSHPGTGKITLITDWSKRSPDAAMPDRYGIRLLSPELAWLVSETRFEIPNLFEPGTYTLHIANQANSIRLDGTIVSLYPDIVPHAASHRTRGSEVSEEIYYFYQVPGYFFWGSVTQAIEADRDYEITVPMRQITRPVEIDLTIEGVDLEDYNSFFVYINGTTDAWDCEANKPAGQQMITAIECEPQSGNRLTGQTRMLGVMEDLTIKMELELLIETETVFDWIASDPIDLSEEFKDFNTTDRTVPLVIKKTVTIRTSR